MSCKVASVQKMHRGHPRTGYFRNEKSTTRGDGINRARCPVLSGQTETTTGGPEREKGEGWDAQRCSAPAEISSTSGKHIVSTRLVLVNGANPNPLSTVEEWMAVLFFYRKQNLKTALHCAFTRDDCGGVACPRLVVMMMMITVNQHK